MSRYEVKLSTGDSPILYLENQLTIGKFGQNLNLDHPDISEKHCTLVNDHGVLSIIDHSSDKGTFINGKSIPVDQPILLEKDDQIVVGSVGVIVKKVVLADEPDIPDLPKLPDIPEMNDLEVPSAEVAFADDGDLELDMSPQSQFEVAIEEEREGLEVVPNEPTMTKILDEESLIAEIASETETRQELPPKIFHDDAVVEQLVPPIQKKKFKPSIGEKDWGVPYFIRFFALLIDINLAVFLTQMLIEYDALFLIESGFNELEAFIKTEAGIEAKYFLPYLIVHITLVLLGNLFFKRSLGKLVLFVSVEGTGLLSRLKAFCRGLLGLFIWPFIIFDFPSLFSKPTVKEVIFGSRFYLSSKLISFVLALIMLPLSFGIAYMTSFLERFPLEEYNSFEYKTISFAGNANSQGIISSLYFDFEKTKRTKIFLEYPYFKTLRKKKKKFFVPAMRIYYPAEKLLVRFERTQEKIDLKKMLSYAIRSNPLASLRFGEVIKFINNQPYNALRFYEEFKNLTKSSLELNLKNIGQHFLQYGPFFKSFFDYRDSLLSSIGKRIQDVRFVKIGEKQFMKITPPRGKFAENNLIEDIFVPLERANFSILRFQIESNRVIPEETVLKFYRQYLGGVEWNDKLENQPLTKKLGAYEIIDYFSQKKAIEEDVLKEHAYIFRYYFKVARLLVKSSNKALKDDYFQKLKSFFDMIVGLNQKERKRQDDLRESSLEEAKYDYLIRKINEVMDAFKTEDLAYFSSNPGKKKSSPQPAEVPFETPTQPVRQP